MANPLYPNVPLTLGVPAVLRLPGQIDPPDPRLRSESGQLDDALAQQQWGIFDQNGTTVVNPDNVVAVDDGVEYRVPTYPLEEGGFESYNKVATPIDVHLAMSKGGALIERQEFLKSLKALVPKLDLYHVVTPEEVFINMNIVAARKSRHLGAGATMITVEVTLQEIRVGAKATLSSSKEPSGASPVNNGSVQTTSFDTFPGFATIRDIK